MSVLRNHMNQHKCRATQDSLLSKEAKPRATYINSNNINGDNNNRNRGLTIMLRDHQGWVFICIYLKSFLQIFFS